MKKYSKANGIEHWRAAIGKHEIKKTRKRSLSFSELQSYAEGHGVTTAQQKSKQEEAKLPQTVKHREAHIKKERRKVTSQTRREHHHFNEFRMLTLLGILLMLAGKVGGNRRNNLGYQFPPASQGLIRQYWENKQATSSMVPDVTEEFKRASMPEELFYPLNPMAKTHLPDKTHSGLTTSRHIFEEARERSHLASRDLISSIALQTPLHRACKENNIEAVRKLLSKGADFTLENGEGKTAFDVACEKDALSIVRLLLEYGYDAETPVKSDIVLDISVTHLFLAVYNDNYKLAYTLLKYGRAGAFPLLIEMAEKNNNLKMKELLQAHLSKPPRKATDLVGVSTVAEESTVRFQGKERFNQVNQEIFEISTKVQTEGFYIQPRGRNFGTCIYETYRDEEGQLKSEHWTFSTSESYEFCLAILLESYEDMVRLFPTVDKNYRLPRGYNWMILSAMVEDTRFANFFLHQGFDVNQTTVTGETALHALALNGKLRSIPNYIAAGADVNAQDNKGMTPLMGAISNKNLKQAKELLAGGADLSIRDKKGRDARTIAFRRNWLHELNQLLLSLGREPLWTPSKAAQAETVSMDIADDSWMSQYGAVLAGMLITLLSVVYYAYRQLQQAQQQSIQSAPLVKPKKKAAVIASEERKITPSEQASALVIEPNAETAREKARLGLEDIKSGFHEKREKTYPQEDDIKIGQTRALNTLYRLRRKAQSWGMEGRCEAVFTKIDRDIDLLNRCAMVISRYPSRQHQATYEHLMIEIQNPELNHESLKELCQQIKILYQEMNEEKTLFLEKQEQARKAIDRIERNLNDLEEKIIRTEGTNHQASERQQDEESKQKTHQEQRELDRRIWAEKKEQRKLRKMEEMNKNKGKEKEKEEASSAKGGKGKERAFKKSRKWRSYLNALRSDVNLLENILNLAKINSYLSVPQLLSSCQFYGSCYYVMRIFHRVSKMHKFGLEDYAPCSADEAMNMRNAIMHQYQTCFSHPGYIIAIAGEAMQKLRHTLDALLAGEPAQQMHIPLSFPQDVRYSKIKVLDKIYEDYLKVAEEARRLVLDQKYDNSRPFHGILKAFNFMLGQILKDFGILENPFLAHRDDIGHRFDTDAPGEEGEGLSEEINPGALFELCEPPAMEKLAALVNECQRRAGVNLAFGSPRAASSCSSGTNSPRFFEGPGGSGSSTTPNNFSMAPQP